MMILKGKYYNNIDPIHHESNARRRLVHLMIKIVNCQSNSRRLYH